MNYNEAWNSIKQIIRNYSDKAYDGIIVKKLGASNTLDEGRTTNQTHIAITGEQMDFFPHLEADGYFTPAYTQRDEGLKKYFTLRVPMTLYKKNIEELTDDISMFSFQDNESVKVHVCVFRGRRKDQADQVQLSLTNMDDGLFLVFRRLVHEGDYFIMLKQKESLAYDCVAIRKNTVNSATLDLMNNHFYKDNTFTPVDSERLIYDEAGDNNAKDVADIEIDEYIRAAEVLKKYVYSTNKLSVTEFSDIEKSRNEFLDRFSPDKLKELPDEKLLDKVFYTQGDNTESLCCWIEMNKECKKYFGSISGGSAYKFGLFQKQDNGKWVTGGPLKPQELSFDEAVELGKRIVAALLKGASIIRESTLESLDDYEKLDDKLQSEVTSEGIYYNWAWFHKYYSILFPEKFSSFHSEEWQKHVLRALRIKPSEKYYARSGQIAMVQRAGGWWYRQLGDIFFQKFGEIKQFIRLGSSDDRRGYASEWKKESMVGIGWSKIGSLEDYKDEDGRLDKSKIAEKMQEVYYQSDLSTASRKAGELIRFYESNKNSVFVVADGEKLIGLVDEIGEYYYDDSNEMSSRKAGKWRTPFSADEKLPNKSEGLMTSCTQIKKEENIMYLYEKYYYSDGENIEDVDPLEDDDKMKNCLEIDRLPRKDRKYPLNIIIYGAPGTGKTYGTVEYALKILGVPIPNNRKEVVKTYNKFVQSGQIVFTTFHQSYGYEEFIQGLRPDTKSDKMTFKTVDGVFKRIADRALNDLENNYVIIIDEINRANISKVFGELITLIEDDKRWGEINETCATLQSGDVFAVPNNLYIVGTMNSADKSISLIDAALRRRFIFREQRPNADLITDPKLKAFFERLNSYLYDSLGSADLLIGHSYFMDKTISDLPNIMNDSIIPLLYEYFYDNKKNINKALEDTVGKVDYTVVDNKTGRLFVIEKV